MNQQPKLPTKNKEDVQNDWGLYHIAHPQPRLTHIFRRQCFVNVGFLMMLDVEYGCKGCKSQMYRFPPAAWIHFLIKRLLLFLWS
jgi:hypothetical protein